MVRRALAHEANKLLRRRTTRALLKLLAATPPLLAVAFVLLLAGVNPLYSPWLEPTLNSPRQLLTVVFGTSGLISLVLGVLTLSAEYGSGTILRTYQAFPRRWDALLAKALLLVVGPALAAGVAVGGGLVVLGLAPGPVPAPASAPLVMAGFVVHATAMALLGLGVALVLSRSVPSLVTAVGAVYVLPEVVRLLSEVFGGRLEGAVHLLPSEASRSMLMTGILGDAHAGLPPGLGIATASVTIVVLLLAGLLVQGRRSI